MEQCYQIEPDDVRLAVNEKGPMEPLHTSLQHLDILGSHDGTVSPASGSSIILSANQGTLQG